ncbi:MAG: nucleotidyltransferase family protein [Ruminococcus sp.]|nr:nucleotidyltransferase family protein [Ruminococcus sp.]
MAVALICEFNPFHNGHQYIIETAKKITGEPVVAVMSGSFVQRGEPALTDKFERTRAALENGASLVTELPAVYAVANAQRFAGGGARIANALRGVNYLAFGCECDDISLLKKAAAAPSDLRVQSLIKKKMQQGDYYPRALESAVREVFGDETADFLKTPNNILAAEYIKQLDKRIKPLPIKRRGAAHNSKAVSGGFASASAIRSLLRGGKPADGLLPRVPSEITFPERLDAALLYRMRTISAQELRALPEVGEGLENRLLSAAKTAASAEELISAVKTKRYTHARIRRILTCALLGITEELQSQKSSYCRVLGFSEEGARLLKNCEFEIVTSAAKGICGENAEFIKKDILAADIAAIAYENVRPCGEDFCAQIIKC